MSTATLDKPVTLTNLAVPSQRRSLNLKLAHSKAGLCCRDLQYLDAPTRATPRGLKFKGVSIK